MPIDRVSRELSSTYCQEPSFPCLISRLPTTNTANSFVDCQTVLRHGQLSSGDTHCRFGEPDVRDSHVVVKAGQEAGPQWQQLYYWILTNVELFANFSQEESHCSALADCCSTGGPRLRLAKRCDNEFQTFSHSWWFQAPACEIGGRVLPVLGPVKIQHAHAMTPMFNQRLLQ